MSPAHGHAPSAPGDAPGHTSAGDARPGETRAGETRPGETRAGDARTAVITAGAAAQATAENFPVALRLLPARYRRHLMAVYGFARTVDDIGDAALPAATAAAQVKDDRDPGPQDPGPQDPGPQVQGGQGQGGQGQGGQGQGGQGQGDQDQGDQAAERLRLLDELEDDLSRLYRGEAPRLEVIGQLAATVAECGVPDQPLRDLIQANRQDQLVSRYQTFDDLVGYCELSANPVGRIVLHVFGAYSPRRAQLSDHVCTALQLAEHWQDVAEDLRAGRIYLPLDDLDRFGCTEQDLAAPAAGPQVRALMSFQVVRASALLSAGSPLIASLHGAARVAVAGYVAGGRAALAAIEAAQHDVLAATPRPGKRRLIAELARAYTRGR